MEGGKQGGREEVVRTRGILWGEEGGRRTCTRGKEERDREKREKQE